LELVFPRHSRDRGALCGRLDGTRWALRESYLDEHWTETDAILWDIEEDA